MSPSAPHPMPPPAGDVPFWEQPETVERFASREPDHRLRALAAIYPDPPRVRVLDLGCAGGRNTAFLADRGFDVMGLDGSAAMVSASRSRLGAILGEAEAARRVRAGRMDRLEAWEDGTLDLVVALGIFHSAETAGEWERALRETHRVLGRGGLVLVANFTPATDPGGKGLVAVPGDPGRFEGMVSGRSTLFEAEALDREFRRRGFLPFRPTETVSREAEGGGRRVTANALYLRP